MMTEINNGDQLETLKKILENIKAPQQLDTHPWVSALFVRRAVENHPAWAGFGRGQQLLLAISGLFEEMMPQTPPRQGKRLDTRWGRFGILAAQYFAPFLHGRLCPETLRDAWRRIDDAIALFALGEDARRDPKRAALYRLIGAEPDIPANSTISDWHRGGLEVLLELLLNREQYLSASTGRPSPVLCEAALPAKIEVPVRQPVAPPRPQRRFALLVLALICGAAVLIAALVGGKLKRVIDLGMALKQDIDSLEAVSASSLETIDFNHAGSLLNQTSQDVNRLQSELRPWYWVTSRMGWAPGYLSDLAQMETGVEMAASFMNAVDLSYRAVVPIVQVLTAEDRQIAAADLTNMLLASRPALLQAQDQMRAARALRQQIDPEVLSPAAQRLVLRADPYLNRFEELLTVSIALPGLLGAADDGPKTYLILVQNEDELRPSGGFITAVGKVVVFKGEIINWSVQDSTSIDQPTKTYPTAPWQLRSFLNLPVFVFRDANWYTDFPTTVTWVEYLYAYSNATSVDGVIAIDQQTLVRILAVTGPLLVDELGELVAADNIEAVMRSQKMPSAAEASDPNWNRKQFMQPIAEAVLNRVLTGENISWNKLVFMLKDLLDQRHILVQVDDPAVTTLLKAQGWDGAVQREPGDFLMVVDSNVGGNKANAVVSSSLSYDVNLVEPAAPMSELIIFQENKAPAESSSNCDQLAWRADPTISEFWYPIHQCYYSYLRVFSPAGTALAGAGPHPVSRDDMVLLDQDVPPRVDTLNERIDGIAGFGTLLVVPRGQSQNTSFRFALPGDVFLPASKTGAQTYRLKIQKQGGVRHMPVTVRVHLPAGAKVQSVSANALVEGQHILFQFDLIRDTRIEVVFIP